MLIAMTLVLVTGPLGQAHRWKIAEARTWAIPASIEGLPFRPGAGVKPAAVGLSMSSGQYGVQIFHHFRIDPAHKGSLAVLLPVVSGDSRLFLNGVPVPVSSSSPDSYLTLAGAGSRLWTAPAEFLRPGMNRIDLVIAPAPGRSLTGPILLGPRTTLARLQSGLAEFGLGLRHLLGPLLTLAAALSVLAAAAGRQPLPWLGLSAAAAAMAARVQFADQSVLARLDLLWPVLANITLASALICVGCSVLRPRDPEPTWVRWSLVAGVIGLAVSLGLALIASQPGAGQDQGSASLLPCLGLIFAVWAGWRSFVSDSELSASTRVLRGLAAGVLAIVALAGVGGAMGLFWGEFAIAAEVSFGLGLAGLASGLAASAGAVATVGAWRRLKHRPNLGRIIQRQQAQIEAASIALQNQQRHSDILEERQRLARDMHDGIGGHLASLLARVRSRKISLDQMETELAGGLSELRLLVDSLDAAGESLAEAMAAFRVRIRPQVEAAGMSLVWSQPEDLEIEASDPRWVLNLYRFMQEAVTNAVRHSGGDRLTITIGRPDKSSLSVMVEDNGAGFERTDVRPGKGLSNMTYRAAQMGGQLVFARPASGRGAIVRADLKAPRQGLESGPALQSSGEIMPS